jgi:hypothetical protein
MVLRFFRKNKNFILNLSLKKIYAYFFLNDFKKIGYFNFLKDLCYDFFSSKYPFLKKDRFEKNLIHLINYYETDLAAQYNSVFHPDFERDLSKWYKSSEKQIFLRFIRYSINPKLITKRYADIYDFAINRIEEPLEILEIGGGIPHGLIYNIWKKDKSFVKKITYIEADMIHTEFVDWFCKKNSLEIDTKLFTASKTPTVNNINFNFVFAKDIFEHLENPAKLIDELIENTINKKTLLCLDLEHKGGVTVDHINPNLPILKEKLINNNFNVIKKFEEVEIWEKI